MRGTKPSCMAWRVTEKAPEMTACEAMTVASVARITIGDRVFFGPRVGLYTPYHPIDAAVRASGPEGARPITIGNDVWFGGSVVVCPGVTIGDDVVIGAGSVVTKDIPSHSVAVGNPCHVIRKITDADREYWEGKAAEYRAWNDSL